MGVVLKLRHAEKIKIFYSLTFLKLLNLKFKFKTFKNLIIEKISCGAISEWSPQKLLGKIAIRQFRFNSISSTLPCARRWVQHRLKLISQENPLRMKLKKKFPI